MEFKIGEIVKLKSGGPDMTIQGVLELNEHNKNLLEANGFKDGDLICVWFDEKGNRKSDYFNSNSLEKVKKSEPKITPIGGLRF